jgi:hypothetical protein
VTFPLTVGDRTLADGPALAALVRDAAGLDRGEAVALATALLAHPDAATVCEGARLASALGERALAGALLSALTSLDTALLMQVDPGRAGESVEDTLLLLAATLADLDDDAVRRDLLERLRNAGLPHAELRVLCEHGDAEDLRTWLPAVLTEDLGDDERDALARRVARGDEGAEVVRALAADVLATSG